MFSESSPCLLAWVAWQLQCNIAKCGTLRKHFTKPFKQPAAQTVHGHALRAGMENIICTAFINLRKQREPNAGSNSAFYLVLFHYLD